MVKEYGATWTIFKISAALGIADSRVRAPYQMYSAQEHTRVHFGVSMTLYWRRCSLMLYPSAFYDLELCTIVVAVPHFQKYLPMLMIDSGN